MLNLIWRLRSVATGCGIQRSFLQGSHLCCETRSPQALSWPLGTSTALPAGSVAPLPRPPAGLEEGVGRAFRPTWRISCALNGGAVGLSSGG